MIQKIKKMPQRTLSPDSLYLLRPCSGLWLIIFYFDD